MKINSIAAETGQQWIQETKEISVMLAGLSKTKRKLLSDWNLEPETWNLILWLEYVSPEVA